MSNTDSEHDLAESSTVLLQNSVPEGVSWNSPPYLPNT